MFFRETLPLDFKMPLGIILVIVSRDLIILLGVIIINVLKKNLLWSHLYGVNLLLSSKCLQFWLYFLIVVFPLDLERGSVFYFSLRS